VTGPAVVSEIHQQPFSTDKQPSLKLLPSLLEILFDPKAFTPFRKRPLFPVLSAAGEEMGSVTRISKNLIPSNEYNTKTKKRGPKELSINTFGDFEK
jgi:hypothetical protein